MQFPRSKNGKNTLIVWACNTDGMQGALIDLAGSIGGEALLGFGQPFYKFAGPPNSDYYNIARRTVHGLNNGASFSDLGITDEIAQRLAQESETIGSYLAKLRQEMRKNRRGVVKLVGKEQCKMWVIVIAGNEPENDVAALTRGQLATADVDRLLVATGANIVSELKSYPEKIGVLANVFDCRILYLPILAALAITRDFGNEDLKKIMNEQSLSTRSDKSGLPRLMDSEIAFAFTNQPIGTRKPGSKIGPNTLEAFLKLEQIASYNDKLLNRAFAEALLAANLIQDFDIEVNFGTGLTRRTDIYCNTNNGPVRIEMMWRTKTGRADIANYVLTKLYNYGRAIGFLA